VARNARAVWRGLTTGEVKRQAGGIVVRPGPHGPLVLVVSARRSRKRWVLPKGTVEPDETPAEAAMRELWEEAGVRGRLLEPVGSAEYFSFQGRIRCDYFVVRYTSQTPHTREDRKRQWCAVEDAISLLTYASARRVLLEAFPSIEKVRKKKARRVR
jgi:8-oxo-dGTP pyrophosphatase MutT (NUDIX family)